MLVRAEERSNGSAWGSPRPRPRPRPRAAAGWEPSMGNTCGGRGSSGSSATAPEEFVQLKEKATATTNQVSPAAGSTPSPGHVNTPDTQRSPGSQKWGAGGCAGKTPLQPGRRAQASAGWSLKARKPQLSWAQVLKNYPYLYIKILGNLARCPLLQGNKTLAPGWPLGERREMQPLEARRVPSLPWRRVGGSWALPDDLFLLANRRQY